MQVSINDLDIHLTLAHLDTLSKRGLFRPQKANNSGPICTKYQSV